MSLDPEDPRVRSSVFGQQVQDFLASDIGDYLLMFARTEVESATAELIEKAHELDKDKIRDLQTRIWRAERFQTWLGEAIQAGLMSLKALEEDR